jgi:predicted RNA-binding Zn-ribbon protein involved in translation (DUF1610 family)
MSKMSDLHIEMQQNEDIVLCPACNKNFYTPYGVYWEKGMPSKPALSRKDNKTYICSPCGTGEAFDDFVEMMGD